MMVADWNLILKGGTTRSGAYSLKLTQQGETYQV